MLSLARARRLTRIIIVTDMRTMPPATAAKPIRVTEDINGRAYVIEVLPVDAGRWRARLAQSGTTNAVMPFYGGTPDEAVAQLSRWLSRVGRPAAAPR